ncbi:transposase, partial [Xanthomonas phaseoli]|uniref:transposase n=2 Tax=Xanthomonas phaseoli TaxID=1985254 RepID=UPI0021521513
HACHEVGDGRLAPLLATARSGGITATTLFDTIEQVQDKATRWLWTYNHERPNMALGGITPAMKLAMAA